MAQVKELSGADDERIEEFFRYGAWINVNAAPGSRTSARRCIGGQTTRKQGFGPTK